MSGVEIDPDGVNQVISKISDDLAGLDAELSLGAVGGMFEQMSWGDGIIACVPDAVAQLVNQHVSTVSDIVTRVSQDVDFVIDVAQAYVDNDLDMAAAIDAAAGEPAGFDR